MRFLALATIRDGDKSIAQSMISSKSSPMNRSPLSPGVFNAGGMDGGVDVKFDGTISCGEKMPSGNALRFGGQGSTHISRESGIPLARAENAGHPLRLCEALMNISRSGTTGPLLGALSRAKNVLRRTSQERWASTMFTRRAASRNRSTWSFVTCDCLAGNSVPPVLLRSKDTGHKNGLSHPGTQISARSSSSESSV